MITPASTVDWIMGATMLGTIVAFAAAAHRWMPEEIEAVAPATQWQDLRHMQVDEMPEKRLVGARGGP